MKFLKAFAAFWYDFIIGDDWKIAAYTVTILAVVAFLAVNTGLTDAVLVVVAMALLCAAFVAGVLYDARKLSG